MALPVYLSIVVAISLAVMMTGLGATVSWEALRAERPLRVGGAVLVQFLCMPFLAWLVAEHVLSLTDTQAVGLVLVGCAPGGTASNLLEYAAGANVPLGIVITVVSNTLAIGTLPLSLFIYTEQASDFGADIVIPYGQLALSLSLTTVAVAIGIWVKTTKSERTARRVERIGAALGFALIGGGAIGTAFFSDNRVSDIPPIVFASATILSFAGIAIGLLFGGLMRLDRASWLTVALETGVQNASLVIAVLTLTFEEPVRTEALYFPIVYGLWTFIEGAVIAVVFRTCRWYRHHGDDSTTRAQELQKVSSVDDVLPEAVRLSASDDDARSETDPQRDTPRT